MREIKKRSKNYSVKQTDLKEYALKSGEQNVAGGVMNNVLYTFKEDAEKLKVLKRVFDDLKPGGIFILNDPVLAAKTSTANLKEFLSEIGKSAVRNGSPMSEADLAFMVATNRKILASGGQSPFLTLEKLKKLASDAGFVLVEEGTGYYDRVNSLVLRKPQS